MQHKLVKNTIDIDIRCEHSHPPMAFTVPIGSGAAIIPCGNTTATTRYTRFFPSPIQTPRNHLHVACAKKFSSESRRFRAVTEPQATAEVEDEEPMDEEFVALYNKVNDLLREEPDFWEGPQWDLLGFFVKYSWIIGFGVAVYITNYSIQLSFFFLLFLKVLLFVHEIIVQCLT